MAKINLKATNTFRMDGKQYDAGQKFSLDDKIHARHIGELIAAERIERLPDDPAPAPQFPQQPQQIPT